jgi:hypothetical protein
MTYYDQFEDNISFNQEDLLRLFSLVWKEVTTETPSERWGPCYYPVTLSDLNDAFRSHAMQIIADAALKAGGHA